MRKKSDKKWKELRIWCEMEENVDVQKLKHAVQTLMYLIIERKSDW